MPSDLTSAPEATSLVELLRTRAASSPDRTAFTFQEEDGAAITFGQLDQLARAAAALIQAHTAPGDRVLLLYPPGREYVVGFLGCLYAGVIAVPAYPPDPARLARTLPRLQALVADCGAQVALTNAMISEMVEFLTEGAPDLRSLKWLSTSEVSDASAWKDPSATREDLAFLQYTSGSTGSPKGVMLSHGNLLHNLGLIAEGFAPPSPSVGVIWLPPYHDMGLIGGILQPLYGGIPTVLISPLTFLQRPAVWLEEISKVAGQGSAISGGPNFAFDLCVRKTTPEQRSALDLRHWEVAFSGAEPIRQDTLDRFAEAFAVSGFRREAFYPCYGLAEGTLIVTGGPRQGPARVQHFDPGSLAAHAPRLGEGVTLVGSGTVIGDQVLEIVDPQTLRRAAPGQVGEVWLSGPSVARGYWNQPEETAAQLQARLEGVPDRTFLRTGDLGFLQDGQLFVTGRQKDLIIVRGQNLYPQDLERSAERAHPGLRPGCAAAFGIDRDGTEQVAVVLEAQKDLSDQARQEAISAVRRTLLEEHAVAVDTVALIRPGALPKTSSGKIQRRACRAALLDGSLEVLAQETSVPAAGPLLSEPPAAPDGRTEEELARWLGAAAGFLLRQPPIDADAPLAELGLDSLRSMELSGLISASLGRQVGIVDLLRAPSLRALARHLAAEGNVPAAAASSSVDELPLLSEGQRALWFLEQLEPGSGAYNVARAVRLHSEVEAEGLQDALSELGARHPALRTVFRREGGLPRLDVVPDALKLEVLDAASLSPAELALRLETEAQRPFELERGPLVRAQLYRRGDQSVLLLVLHHGITDFWSLSVMVQELAALYQAKRTGAPLALPPPSGAAAALVREEQARLAGPRREQLVRYWRQALAGATSQLDLERSGSPAAKTAGAVHRFTLPKVLSGALQRLAREEQTTTFVVLLAAYFALLHRWTGQDALTVGAPTAGREDPRTHRLLGYRVNPVALQARVEADSDFRALIRQVKQTVLGALEHADLPISHVASALGSSRGPYQTMFVFQRAPSGMEGLTALALDQAGTRVELGGLTVEALPLQGCAAPLELSLVMGQHGDTLAGAFEYRQSRFDAATVERMASQWSRLLLGLTARPDQPLGEHPLLDEAERERLLAMGRGDRLEVPPFPLNRRVAAQASATPHKVALVRGTESVTYQQLWQRVRALASVLAASGVGPEVRVGVAVDRSVDGVVALLAILEAGGAYVPLELRHPDARLSFILADAQPLRVLTHHAHAARLSALGAAVLELESLTETAVAPPVVPEDPGRTAYVIYTSGSTGQPKGVQVPHRGLTNLVDAQIRGFGVTPESRVLQFASCGFDAAISEVAMALGAGATLHLLAAGESHPALELAAVLRAERITTVTLPPSLLALLDPTGLPELRTVISAGEACSPQLVARWAQGRTFINAYGPTEISVCASFGRCLPDGSTPGIGKPIDNAQLYVVDARGQLVPVGVSGELWVGGPGVATGYLGRPELTAQRFLADPFSSTGERVYRTGDRVRWRADGTLEFLGRLDDQVKVRGHRIELGEVEAALRSHLPVRDVAVTVRPTASGEQVLVAYLVPDSGLLPSATELRATLRPHLPEPMIPSAFIPLEVLPLTANGKVDRRALPAPVVEQAEAVSAPPQTPLEKAVAESWAKALGRAAIGVHDHFFEELGGTSLTVMQAAANLREALAQDVPLTHFFEHPTVHAFARRLEAPETSNREEARDRGDVRRAALARRTKR